MYLLQLYCTIKDQNSINDTHLDLLVFCNVLMIFGMKSREIKTIAEEKVGACVKDRIILSKQSRPRVTDDLDLDLILCLC